MNNGSVKIEIRDNDNNQIGVLQISSVTDFPLALNERISDIQNPSKRTGSHSLTFKFPATNENNLTLNAMYDANILDENSIFSKKPIKIVINGIQYKNYTNLKIKTSVHQAGKPIEYDGVIFGEAMAWVLALKEVYLCDIDWVYDGAVPIVYDKPTIEKGWQPFQTPATFDDYDYAFPFVSYGAWEKVDKITVQDLRPQLRVLNVIKRGLASIGYNLVSTFMESDTFNTKVMSFFGSGWVQSQAVIDSRKFEVRANDVNGFWAFFLEATDSEAPLKGGVLPLNLWLIFSDFLSVGSGDLVTFARTERINYFYEASDPENVWDNTLRESRQTQMGHCNFKVSYDALAVRCPIRFTERADGTANFTGAEGFIVSVTIKVFKENTDTGTTTVIGEFDETFAPIFGGLNIGQIIRGFDSVSNGEFETGFIDIVSSRDIVYAEATYSFQVKKEDLFVNDFVVCDARVTFAGLKMTMEIDEKLVEGIEIDDLNEKLDCGTSIMDIIDGLVPVHNFYFTTDTIAQTVTIEVRDEFYEDNTEAKDWSSKLDIAQKYTLESMNNLPQTWKFRWKDDTSDALLQEFKRLNDDRHFGEYELILDDKFVANKTQIISSRLFGTAMNFEDFILQAKASSVGVPWFGAMHKDTGGESEFNTGFIPRFLNYAYSSHLDKDGLDCKVRWHGDTLTVYPICFAAHMRESVGDNLLYHDVDHFDGSSQRGSFFLYWLRTMNVIQFTRLLKGRFLLTDVDMHAVDLSFPIYLSKPEELAGYWIIDKISDYKPTKNLPNTVTLIKRIEIDTTGTPIDSSALRIFRPAPFAGIGVAGGVNEEYYDS